MLRGILALLSVVQLLAAPGPQLAPGRVILITVDSLRADRLGCYGSTKVKTPNIDQLATDGILFTQAIAQSPTTLPSHASILTGCYPLLHGVRDFGFILGPENLTFAEIMRATGYATAAFVGSAMLDPKRGFALGFDQGFDHYSVRIGEATPDSIMAGTAARRGDEVIADALAWIEKQKRAKFFVWVHLFDPHEPYDPPEPYKTSYAANPYEGEVAFVDDVIGRLIWRLKAGNLYQSALLILVSDHGQALGEHGEHGHGLLLYDTTIRVPLIMKLPANRYAGVVYDRQVRTIDILPTTLQVIGLRRPVGLQGIGLLSYISGARVKSDLEAYSETYYPRFQFGWSELKSVRTGKYKLIDGPNPELYNLKQDPGELRNVHPGYTNLAGLLYDRLRAMELRYRRRFGSRAEQAHVDAELVERLKALGYIGYFARYDQATNGGAALPDPKEKVKAHNLLREAMLEAASGRVQEAVEKFKRLTHLEPELFEAHYHLARGLFQLKRFQQAREEFLEASRIRPDDMRAVFALGLSFLQEGDYDRAILWFKRSLEANQHFYPAHHLLGIAYLRKQMAEESIAAFERAARIDPENPEVHFYLGQAYMMKGDRKRADAAFSRAKQLTKR